MSSIKFSCPHCSQHLEAPDSMLGSVLDCPTCGQSISVPGVETGSVPKEPTQEGVPEQSPGLETGAENNEPAAEQEEETAAPSSPPPRPKWIGLAGGFCLFASVVACLKPAFFIAFQPHRPAESIKGYIAAVLWGVAGAGLLRMKRWGAAVLLLLTAVTPLVAIYDFFFHANSVYRVQGATLGGSAAIGALALIWLLVLIPASVGVGRLWAQGRMAGRKTTEDQAGGKAESGSGFAVSLKLVPIITYVACAVLWVLGKGGSLASGSSLSDGMQGFVIGLTFCALALAAVGIVGGVYLSLVSLAKMRWSRLGAHALVYTGMAVVLAATSRAGVAPPVSFILLTCPFVALGLWKRSACYLPYAKKDPEAKRGELRPVALSRVQAVGFVLFLAMFVLADWLIIPLCKWVASFEIENLAFFGNRFFVVLLPLVVVTSTILALLIKSPRKASKLSLAANRVMVLAIFYASTLAWQIVFALDILGASSSQIISRDGSIRTAPLLEGKLALAAICVAGALAVGNLVKLGKARDAIVWVLIALAVGFGIALEV